MITGIVSQRRIARASRRNRPVALASVNVAGGFLVTQRMLEMFRSKKGRGGKPE